MRWWLYNLLFFTGYAAMAPHFYLRMRKRGGYRARFHDRFGRYDAATRARLDTAGAAQRPTWIHAVSVGEVYVAGQLMHAMRQREPGIRFVLSTTSSTGVKGTREKSLRKGSQPRSIMVSAHETRQAAGTYRSLQASRQKSGPGRGWKFMALKSRAVTTT